MSDIKERLRDRANHFDRDAICKEAADHIANLEASVAANQKDAAKIFNSALNKAIGAVKYNLDPIEAAIFSSIVERLKIESDTSTQEVG